MRRWKSLHCEGDISRGAAEIANGRGVRVARLRALTADIAHNLDGDVSVTALALRQQVTPRHIQKPFESEGSTLPRHVLGQHLARCIAGWPIRAMPARPSPRLPVPAASVTSRHSIARSGSSSA